MNIIKLNFIPAELRKEKNGFWVNGIAGIPLEELFGIIAGFVGLLIFVHVLLLGGALVKFTENRILESRWASLGTEKKAFEAISFESKSLQTRLDAFAPALSDKSIIWVMLLNEISDSVPKGVWLTKMTYSGDLLTIYGSSVSKTHNEMVLAGNFVSVLKQKESFNRSFVSIDIDSIQRREGSALSIADFTLKAKKK